MMKQLPAALLLLGATACASKSAPSPSTPAYYDMPDAAAAYRHTSPDLQVQNASLWSVAPNALLSMRSAKDVGDLLTVIVELDDQASLNNSLSRNRDASNDVNIGALLGLTDLADTVLPAGSSLSPAIEMGRSSTMNGGGAVNRAEQIEFRLACRVIGVEPSGNLVIEGFQQIRVSNEVRFLQVSGVIRAQDITRGNTVSYDQIADARLTYVSDGEALAPVQRKAGEKLLDKFLPF